MEPAMSPLERAQPHPQDTGGGGCLTVHFLLTASPGRGWGWERERRGGREGGKRCRGGEGRRGGAGGEEGGRGGGRGG
jgi:hypothetical protein